MTKHCRNYSMRSQKKSLLAIQIQEALWRINQTTWNPYNLVARRALRFKKVKENALVSECKICIYRSSVFLCSVTKQKCLLLRRRSMLPHNPQPLPNLQGSPPPVMNSSEIACSRLSFDHDKQKEKLEVEKKKSTWGLRRDNVVLSSPFSLFFFTAYSCFSSSNHTIN